MKWLVFAFGLVSTIALTVWLRQTPRQRSKLWMIIGALPLVIGAFPKYEIAILGDPEWPGFAKGFNISVIDLIVLAAYFSLPRARTAQRLPFKVSFIFYFGAVLLSALVAPNATATFYYAWQLLRTFIVYAVVARACEDVRLTTSLLKGMAVGFCFQAGVAFFQRFILHHLHVTGTFIHQNDLGFVASFVIFPFFALLLSGRKEWQPSAIPVIGAAVDIITASRATVGLAAFGFSILFLLSFLRKWTARKARILGAAVMVIFLLSPLVYRQFELRFNASPMVDLTEEGGRTALINAASLILADHPWGIGANNLFVVASAQGYYSRANVGVMSADLIPHNLYWVTAAETGYFGVTALIIFLLRPLIFALSCGWTHRKDQRGDLLFGLATSLLIVYIHSYFEWVFLTDYVQYFFAIEIGVIAGLAKQLSYASGSTARAPEQIFAP